MRDLTWTGGPFPSLMNEAGTMLGYTMVIHGGVRGYAIRPGRQKGQRLAKFIDMADHPTAEAAHAWVEAEVARSPQSQDTQGGET